MRSALPKLKRQYVLIKTKDGTEIHLPIDIYRRAKLLKVVRELPMKVFGRGVEALLKQAALLRKIYQGVTVRAVRTPGFSFTLDGR